MQNGTKRQAGGILVFILVGVLLVALLGGGIYLSKQQGRVASRTDTVLTDTTKTDGATSDVAPNSTKEDTPQPQTTTPKPATPAVPSSSGNAAVPATGPSGIAATGPSDIFVPMLALSLLAGGAISYYRSAIAVRTQALKRGL